MKRLLYCLNCKKIFPHQDNCPYCNNDKVKNLDIATSVNVIGTKLKGKVLRIKDNSVSLLITNPDTKDKYIKDYTSEKLKKIL
ncbi:hypothetical protein [Clostridium frigidicarnis]|uniref:Uncharacterized protein n=1 Tax=Clostridium frigidicarnis TaxID=84698 RepID=A0A1I0YWY0_9CLOT|nr:hypothetical protein [Clostridium frigidicarnis]SFB16738.1 hypothetical protein SAMN04488528_101524 [Clostridium frigidicarnis]